MLPPAVRHPASSAAAGRIDAVLCLRGDHDAEDAPDTPKIRQIVARARDVSHWRELRERGIVRLERESFESALRVGRHALETLGVRPYEARERADENLAPTTDSSARCRPSLFAGPAENWFPACAQWESGQPG